MITTTCNFCSAKNVSESVSETIAWDREHDKHCPGRQEVGATQQPITEQFNQGVNEIREGN